MVILDMRIPQQIADHLHVEFCFSFFKSGIIQIFCNKKIISKLKIKSLKIVLMQFKIK